MERDVRADAAAQLRRLASARDDQGFAKRGGSHGAAAVVVAALGFGWMAVWPREVHSAGAA